MGDQSKLSAKRGYFQNMVYFKSDWNGVFDTCKHLKLPWVPSHQANFVFGHVLWLLSISSKVRFKIVTSQKTPVFSPNVLVWQWEYS